MRKTIILSSFALALAFMAFFVPVEGATAKEYLVDDDKAQCKLADFTTLEEAVAQASDGDTILLCGGEYKGVELTKSLTIKPKNAEPVIINDGPVHSSGKIQGFRLLAGSDGSLLNKMIFQVDFPVMNGEGVDGVTVSYNKMINPIQGITNWHGDDWTIRYNEIEGLRTSCGGGIGILIGAFNGTESANNNLVAHNTVTGILDVSVGDCGGYSGTGITLFSDHRYGRLGGPVENNTIRVNKVKLESNNPGLVDVVGFEMTDVRNDESVRDIVDNFVKSNDFRGMNLTIELTPSNLGEFNDIKENKE